jgi:hypothetical protein
MRSTRSAGWFVLPEVVDGSELARIATALQRGVSSPVLDFGQTIHIRWRDAETFARELLGARTKQPSLGTVRLVGLDAYCTQILRFAWPAEAWQLFELVTEDEGHTLGEGCAPDWDSVPALRGWVPDPSWLPSVN